MNPGSDGGMTRPLAASALPLVWVRRPGPDSGRAGMRVPEEEPSFAAEEADAAPAAGGGSLKDSE